MTTQSLTLPPVTPDFQRIVRALGCELGWKNVAKMIAFGPTAPAKVTVVQVKQPTRTRNQWGHKDNYGLPGPNPPRNLLGGFKATGLSAYEKGGYGCTGVAGGTARDCNSGVDLSHVFGPDRMVGAAMCPGCRMDWHLATLGGHKEHKCDWQDELPAGKKES